MCEDRRGKEFTRRKSVLHRGKSLDLFPLSSIKYYFIVRSTDFLRVNSSPRLFPNPTDGQGAPLYDIT